MFSEMKNYRMKDWAQVIFMIMILAAGGYLIIYSVFVMTSARDTNLILFAIAMFGVGCTAIWFGISHVDIQTTEEKLESITARLDEINRKLEKR